MSDFLPQHPCKKLQDSCNVSLNLLSVRLFIEDSYLNFKIFFQFIEREWDSISIQPDRLNFISETLLLMLIWSMEFFLKIEVNNPSDFILILTELFMILEEEILT